MSMGWKYWAVAHKQCKDATKGQWLRTVLLTCKFTLMTFSPLSTTYVLKQLALELQVE